MELSFIQDENEIEAIDGMTEAFPYTMHRRDLSSFTVPWHWHEELEFDYAYRGSIEIETARQTYTIHQGEAYFINTNVMNTKRMASGSTAAMEYAHLFHPVLLVGHFRSVFETKYLNPVLQDQSLEVLILKEDTASGREFLRLLRTLDGLDGGVGQEFQVRNLLSQAWLVLLEELRLQQRKRQPLYVRDRTRDMLRYLHQHYGEKITVGDLAAQVGVSERECIRSFKSRFHQTPMDYLIHYRIEQAKRLLTQTEASVTEIAFQTGFQSSAYFTKTFRTLQGMTPTAFRQQNKAEKTS